MGPDSILIKSTYRDNPFLPESIRKQIEELKYTDEALYQIYALGEKAISKSNIFSTWQFIDKKPEHFTNYIYGLDFGYNHPTALVRIWYSQNELFIEEVIYESYLTTSDLISRLETLGIEKRVEIVADYARPEIIAEIENNGYNIHKADKSVKQGIDTLKSFKVSVPTSSKNIKKEFENYKWKKIGDMIIDEPIKLFDDAIDAARYGCMYIKSNFTNHVGYQTF
jgi:phage terminase large subunit